MVKKKEETKELEEKLDITEVKENLVDYMHSKIDKEIALAIEKSSKKLLRHKNLIIMRKNIIILLLMLLSAFLGYSLYKSANISIDITNKKEKVETKTEAKREEIKTEEQEDKTPQLIEQYGYLVDSTYVDENSSYINDFYKGELPDALKLYLALNHLSEDKITTEDGMTFIDELDLKNSFESLFDGEFNPVTFKYGTLNFKYLPSKAIFLADGEFQKMESNVVKETINVEEEESAVKITTVEGLVKGDSLYNILTNNKIKNYKKDSNLKDYDKSLTLVTYNFSKSGDAYRLSEHIINS